MKKITAVIALAIFVSMAAFGGGRGEQTQDPSAPATYTYHMQITASLTQVITNFGDTELAQELARRTGVTPVYQHPLAGQADEAFNLMVASGDLPDIFEHNIIGTYPGGPEKAIEDGVILDLTDLLPEYAPNLWQYYQENPDVALFARTDTGRYYSFPFVRGDESLMVFFGPVVNRSWLNELGLDMPETIDDWETMLTLFRDEMGAEAPLTYEPGLLNNNNNTFVGAFGATFDFFIDDNGDVQYGPIQPGYRDFLETFARWYEEGLLDVNIESMDRQQVAAKMTTGQSGASIGFAASRLGAWLEAVDGDPDYDFVGVRYPVLNRGDIPMFTQMDFPIQSSAGHAHVNPQARDIEGIMRYMDYAYSEEGNILFNFGIEGESFEWIDGYPTYTDLIFNNPTMSRPEAMGMYVRSSYNGPFVQRAEYFEQYGFTFEQQRESNENWQITNVENHRMPPVTPTPEESSELATIMSDVNTYRDEMRVRYVLGIESLDSFDRYVRNIENMGIARAIEIYTAALERFNNR